MLASCATAMSISVPIAVKLRFVARSELRACMSPLRLFIYASVCNRAQRTNEFPIRTDQHTRERRPRRLIHERHELIRESWHRAANANSSHIRAPADAIHPAAFRHIAIHHRTPATDFDKAFGRTIFVG